MSASARQYPATTERTIVLRATRSACTRKGANQLLQAGRGWPRLPPSGAWIEPATATFSRSQDRESLHR